MYLHKCRNFLVSSSKKGFLIVQPNISLIRLWTLKSFFLQNYVGDLFWSRMVSWKAFIYNKNKKKPEKQQHKRSFYFRHFLFCFLHPKKPEQTQIFMPLPSKPCLQPIPPSTQTTLSQPPNTTVEPPNTTTAHHANNTAQPWPNS